MAEAVTIPVDVRDPAKNKGTGSRVARRLRAKGQIPGIVYGHKQAPQPITIARDLVWEMINNATHLAYLKMGDATEMVLIRDVQWDHLGKEVLHLDFARVRADEQIHTEVKIEMHGTPPGIGEGGVLEQVIRSLKITCPANAIPDSIRIELGELHLDQSIHIRDVPLPPGVVVDAEPDALVVHVVTPRVAAPEPTEVAAEPTTAEPELIGRKPEDKEEKE